MKLESDVHLLEKIKEKILSHLGEVDVSITDKSEDHVGHAGASAGVSHIMVSVTSAQFIDMEKLDRQKLMHKILEKEMKTLHSISFSLSTPEEARSVHKGKASCSTAPRKH